MFYFRGASFRENCAHSSLILKIYSANQILRKPPSKISASKIKHTLSIQAHFSIVEIINEAEESFAALGCVFPSPVPFHTVQYLVPNHFSWRQQIAIHMQQVCLWESRLAKVIQELLQQGSLTTSTGTIQQYGTPLCYTMADEISNGSWACSMNKRGCGFIRRQGERGDTLGPWEKSWCSWLCVIVPQHATLGITILGKVEVKGCPPPLVKLCPVGFGEKPSTHPYHSVDEVALKIISIVRVIWRTSWENTLQALQNNNQVNIRKTFQGRGVSRNGGVCVGANRYLQDLAAGVNQVDLRKFYLLRLNSLSAIPNTSGGYTHRCHAPRDTLL